MQFDLTRLPSMPRIPVANQSRPMPGRARLIGYSVVAVLLLWLLLWSRAQSTKVIQQSKQDLSAFRIALDEDFDAYLKTQPTSAVVLTAKGLAVVEENPVLGAAWLRSAAERDPKYRDGVLGAGFAELKMAESLLSFDAELAQEHTETAKYYLEAAQVIDPIYAYTYELLVIAYTNLGNIEQAADATQKAAVFATQS